MCLPTQGVQVQVWSPVWEDTTWTKQPSPPASDTEDLALEPELMIHNKRGPCNEKPSQGKYRE